jgi:hypothetical protein
MVTIKSSRDKNDDLCAILAIVYAVRDAEMASGEGSRLVRR